MTSSLGNWASFGSGFPIATRIAVASPKSRVICLDGNGSFGVDSSINGAEDHTESDFA
ncbi:thiamine pyrophosphate-dependent enzyme [Microbulbifer sp. A4B17]|uniref:thiamine pyrophosphate-dependent enzyme n=1 Tax=Microbulbifer sp. A4B17 TaxID=359370 RepID=UPI0035167089